ncbi:hypothetical protein [Bosea sp. BK604]|uniref:hypothetical protein n=1 Tax=Bosea sp. BK604 TaxID=2512180 RepID=UPI00104942BF|nr:hypothetical protein [Bosea sp. BK604]TCR64701.1 hypothetical protein EV560_106167 [Bosea sp. BK604]
MTKIYAIAAAVVLALLVVSYTKGRMDGEKLALAKVAQKNTEAANAAREVERDGALCSNDPACVLPDPWRR